MTSRTSILMLLAIAVVGIYVLPAVTARFTGSHTMELNASAAQGLERTGKLQCEKCHTYIMDEFQDNTLSNDVFIVHRAAAQNTKYTNDSGILRLGTDEQFTGNQSACMMCHLITSDRGTLDQTHTKITIRVCTDERCHGDPVGTQMQRECALPANASSPCGNWTSNKLNITTKLALPEDAHSPFYLGLNGSESNYAVQGGVDSSPSTATGSSYTNSFYACLACHTHVGLTFNLSRPVMWGFNMTGNTSGANMTGFTFEYGYINESRAVVTSQKYPASVWG